VAAFQLNDRLVANDTGVTVITHRPLASRRAVWRYNVVWLGAAHIAAFDWSRQTRDAGRHRVRITQRCGHQPAVGRAWIARLLYCDFRRRAISPHLATVGPSGVVSAQWTLGPASGANSVAAAVVRERQRDGNPVGNEQSRFLYC